jgi:3-deoxy-D-manno-octulosonic-acid transferase
MPVVFGPNYQKFKEAHDLIACGGGFSVNGYDALYSVLETFRTADHACSDAGHATRTYVESMQGAADLILKEIS